jgi:biotin transport system substrate-specific component
MTIALPRLNRLPAAERGITIADFLVPIRVGERISSRARHAALVIAGAVIVALAAQVEIIQQGQTIPLIADYRLQLANTPVPITGQTFGVLLVGGALGLRRGALALLLYLALGLVLPVYAGGASGVDQFASLDDGRLILGVTGGYLIGFVFAAALTGWLAELGWDRRLLGSVGAMVLASIAVYVLGVAWLMAALDVDLATGLALGVTPFLIVDALKLIAAAVLFPAASRRPNRTALGCRRLGSDRRFVRPRETTRRLVAPRAPRDAVLYGHAGVPRDRGGKGADRNRAQASARLSER